MYAYVSPLHNFNTRKIAIMRDMGWEIPCPPFTYFSGIVYADRVVTGCNVSMQSVAVINNAKLTVDTPGSVTINGPFSVALGSSLQVK